MEGLADKRKLWERARSQPGIQKGKTEKRREEKRRISDFAEIGLLLTW